MAHLLGKEWIGIVEVDGCEVRTIPEVDNVKCAEVRCERA